MRRPSAATVSSIIAVGGSVAFVLWQLHPALLFANTTTSGGDLGAHVDLPAFLRNHLLPQGRLTGWSNDWYAGYPALTFYFPLPSLAIALLSYVVPFNIAFKLVTASGLLALPVAAWAFGRLAGTRRPVPECLAVATLPFLFDTSFTIYGGNIASTMAGEYSFSIALAIGLVFLGLVARGLEDGRHRALAASLLALTVLCHMVPALFVAFGAVVLVVMRADRRRLRWAVPVGVVGTALTAFWAVPFVFRQQYTTDMGWQKITTYMSTLFPGSETWVVVLAAVGVVLSVALRRRIGIFLTVMAVASAAAFVLTPQGKLYNARVLPFWVLCLYLLAGVAVAELGVLLARGNRFLLSGQWRLPVREAKASAGLPAAAGLLGPHDSAGQPPQPAGWGGASPEAATSPRSAAGPPPWRDPSPEILGLGGGSTGPSPGRGAAGAVLTPVVAFLAAAVFVLLPLVDLPGWFPFTVTKSVVPSWVAWDYSGYQEKASYPEYRSLITTMERVGAEHGCGRAMWEYEPQEVQLGTTMALMLLPYWSNGCIGSMEGLLFESSATTPYHFINQSELSQNPSRAMVGLPYGPLDVSAGVRHLQLLGVRYYMATSTEAELQAARDRSLRLVATSGPWPVTFGSRVEQQTWDIYEVRGSATVAPLSYEPAVLTGQKGGARGWLDTAVPWYGDPARWAVPLAASGPASWPRVRASDAASPPRRRVAPARVSHIVTTDSSISFDVDRTGSPVLVKTSYFPNWQASGATGPYRVTPNQMVVVPTSKHVTLHYGYTPVDIWGWVITAAGLAGLVALAVVAPVDFGRRFPRRRRRAPGHPGERPVGEAELVGAQDSPGSPSAGAAGGPGGAPGGARASPSGG